MIETRTMLHWALCLPLLAGAAAAPAATGDDFAACIADLRATAVSEGISAAPLADVQPVERVIELDRAQPEFTTTFADYLDRRVTEVRVERGRALLEEHEALLADIYREYGIPPRYLVALWGIESGFGSYFGRMPVLDSVATLACDARRSEYYSSQVLAALRIVDGGPLEPRDLKGSWAGAMGHVQFMPEIFLRHAVDHDGDGRRDLWGSVPDAMASAANFLRELGWKSGWRWGREVLLPADFPYQLAGHERRSLAEWRELGVRTAYGGELPNADIEASLLVVAGHEGPAFLVYENFDAILRWNRSEFYGLAVGHLADRLAGREGLTNPPPTDAARLSRKQVIALQEQLKARGFDPGPTDGIPGPQTREATRAFQQAHDMVPDGFASKDLLTMLDASAPD